MSDMFHNSDFNQEIDGWDVSNVTTMRYMFAYSEFNSSIASWDVSSVTNMLWMFGYSAFNLDIGDWDVGNVINMSSMFRNSDFNQDIGDWDVSNVTDMSNMFRNSDFNQDIGGWGVGNVTNMLVMFGGSNFNQDIGNWDVSKVINMLELFDGTPFNKDISSWDVSNVTNMMRMFRNSEFNQDIGGWDVSSVTNMQEMFSGSEFNQDIGSWDVSNVNNMMYMFWGSDFNQDISGWDVSNVTTMSDMFAYSDFNQDIGGWNVSSVTNMQGMFYLSDFNQDISNWDVSNVENFSSFLSVSELSTENYNKLLIKWSELDLQQGINFSGGNSKYDLGLPQEKRQFIIDEFGWTFNDDGNTGNEVFLLTLYANPKYAGEVEGEGLYYSDDNVDVKAFANMGYEFANWTDNDSEEVDTEAEFVFVMPAEAVSLTANFSHIDYQLTVNINPEGAGSVSGEGAYIMNQEVTLAATANEGYGFINWTDGENILSDDETYFFTMPAEVVTITANFSETTSITEADYANPVKIYPNPAQNHINISGLDKNSTIEIFSITGAKMMRLENQSGNVNLNVSNLENDIYIIRISSEKGVLSRNIFINK
ncbi:Por secretion system C-terminal sorting domain-containing protein [Alkalitalea saponilacus]|uniref:Por secretion system C-terminal sorting domain-containing protein n=2 Tax=Alkalitalea saponilacus TaxID=889453 RepID=A0A1T5D4B4_9BACT|nr:Por secretion system C-terminal sorting domain-containing protein [Alkalitalea saponilacus]